MIRDKQQKTKIFKSVQGSPSVDQSRQINLKSILQMKEAGKFNRELLIYLQQTIGNQAVCQLLSEAGLIKDPSKKNLVNVPAEKIKSNMENISGVSLADVKVRYNSGEPSKLGALAFTKGNEIHVAPGQEKHLPHEMWHAVQQKQGRVRPTGSIKGNKVNGSKSLEHEADIMGARALSAVGKSGSYKTHVKSAGIAAGKVVQKKGTGKKTAADVKYDVLKKDSRYQYFYFKFLFIRPFLSEDDYDANVKKFSSSFWAEPLYDTGQIAGVVPGILEGVWDIIVSIKDLIVLIAKADWYFLKKAWKFANDPRKTLEDAIKTLGGAASMAKDAANAIVKNPKIILDAFKTLGSMAYGLISEKLTAWSKKIPFWQGYAVGELVGQIVFFVASMFIGVGEAAAAVKVGGAAVKLLGLLRTMKLPKIAEALEVVIESKAALKIAKELEKANKISKEVTKTGKAVKDAAKTRKVVKKEAKNVKETVSKHPPKIKAQINRRHYLNSKEIAKGRKADGPCAPKEILDEAIREYNIGNFEVKGNTVIIKGRMYGLENEGKTLYPLSKGAPEFIDITSGQRKAIEVLLNTPSDKLDLVIKNVGLSKYDIAFAKDFIRKY